MISNKVCSIRVKLDKVILLIIIIIFFIVIFFITSNIYTICSI